MRWASLVFCEPGAAGSDDARRWQWAHAPAPASPAAAPPDVAPSPASAAIIAQHERQLKEQLAQRRADKEREAQEREAPPPRRDRSDSGTGSSSDDAYGVTLYDSMVTCIAPFGSCQ